MHYKDMSSSRRDTASGRCEPQAKDLGLLPDLAYESEILIALRATHVSAKNASG